MLSLACALLLSSGCYSGLAGIAAGAFQFADDDSRNGAGIAPQIANLDVPPDGPLGRATNLEEVRVVCDVIPGSAPLQEVAAAYSLTGESFTAIEPASQEEVGTRHVFVWNAARDGLSGLNEGVHVRVMAKAATGAVGTATGVFDLGNTPPALTDLGVVGAEKSPVTGTVVIHFTLRYASRDPADIRLEVIEDGGEPQEIGAGEIPVGTLNELPTNPLDCIVAPPSPAVPGNRAATLTILPGRAPPPCQTTTLAWNTVSTLGERNLTNLTLRVTPRDPGTNGQGVSQSTSFNVNNNAPPRASLREPAANGDEWGSVRVQLLLFDDESQPADAVVQWSATQDGFPDLGPLADPSIRRAALEDPVARAELQIVTPRLRTLLDASATVPLGHPADVLVLQDLAPPTGLTCARLRGAALDLLAPNGDVEQTRTILRDDCDCCEVDATLQRLRLDAPLDPPPRKGQRVRIRESLSRIFFDLPATPAGRQHSFAWDTLQDLGLGCDGQSVFLRVTPFAAVAQGTAFRSTVEKPVQTNRARFAAADDLSPALGPSSAALQDTDQDGILDILTADRLAGEVSVFLGLGDGSYSPRKSVKTDGEPILLAPVPSGDDDPSSDVLVLVAVLADGAAEKERGFVDVYAGLESGELARRQRLAVGGEITELISTDLLDGPPAEIVAGTRNALPGSGGLAIFRRLGDGTFEPVSSSRIVGDESVSDVLAAASADFDGNGLNDLLIAAEGGQIHVYLQTDPEKPFTRVLPSLETGTSPDDLIVGQLNDDDHWDVVSAGTRAGELSVFYSNGDGTFQDGLPLPAGAGLTAAVAADLNQDGRSDLVALVADHMSFFLNDLDGTLVPAGETLEVGTLPRALAAGDVNRDGMTDLIGVDGAANSLKVRVFLGQGIFAAVADSEQETQGEPLSMKAADLDGDLDLDLVVGTRDPAADDEPTGAVRVFLNDGEGEFTAADLEAVQAPVQSLAAADFNGDGHLDIASAERSVTSVRPWIIGVFLGDGSGSLSRHTDEIQTHDGLIALDAGDFDGDGHLDLVSAEVQRLMLYRGNGDGSFGPGEVSVTGALREQPLEVADLNGDGTLDLMTSDRLNLILLFFGDGDGQFVPSPIGFRRPSFPNALTAGDLNADGLVDLVSVDSTPSSSQVTVFEGVEKGKWEEISSIVSSPVQLAAALVTDLNHDGRQDLVTAGAGGISVFLQSESGLPHAPQSPRSALGSNPPTALIAADVNGDGDKDLIVAERSRMLPDQAQRSNLLSVFLNRFRGVLPRRGDGQLRAAAPFRCR